MRGLLAAAVLALLSGLILNAKPGQTVAYFLIGMIAYTPISYYTRHVDLQPPPAQQGQARRQDNAAMSARVLARGQSS